MLPKKEENAINLVALSIIISFLVSLVSLFIVFVFNTPITNLLGNPEIANWLYFIPLTVLLTGIYQSLNYWNNRKKQYKRLATSRIVQSATTATSNLSMGFWNIGNSGLIFGQILGQSVATTILGKLAWDKDKNQIKSISRLKMFVLSKKYIDYPKKSSLGAFFNSLSYQLEYILFSIFFLLKYVGIYFFVNKIINIPKQFLSGSIWQSFLSHSQESTSYILHSLKSKQEKLIKYSMLPMLSSLFILPELFVFIFGEGWREATTYFLPLILAMHVNFIVSSFSLFVIVNRPDMEMKFNFFLAFFKITAIYFSYVFFDNILISIYALSMVQTIMFFWLGAWNYQQLGESFFYFFTLYGKYLLISFIPLSLLYGIALQNNLLLDMLSYAVINSIFIRWMMKS
jgi:O-antigen/teichoic acid export membrane protein